LQGGGSGGSVKGLPYFWVNALCGHDTIAELITRRDRQALGYCTDVRYVKGARGMLVEFHFAENPFFENAVLRKGIYLETDAKGRPVEVRDEATQFEWKSGNSLLLREVAAGVTKGGKKGKKGGGKASGGKGGDSKGGDGSVGGGKRLKPAASFFRFFTPVRAPTAAGRAKELDPTAVDDDDDDGGGEGDGNEVEEEEGEERTGSSGSGGDGMEELQLRRRERDGKTLNMLVKQVVPRAVHLYLNGPMAGAPLRRGRSDADIGGGKGDGTDDGVAADDDEDNEQDDGFEVVSGAAVGGGVASLPPAAQKVVCALRSVQAAVDASCRKLKEAKHELRAEEERRKQAMADARAAALLLPGPPPSLSLPNFWLRALRALDAAADCVQRRDEAALSRVKDVRFKWDFEAPLPAEQDGTRSATLELHFLPGNPYFPDELLSKRYTFSCVGGSWSRLRMRSSEVKAAPSWAEGRNLTTRSGPDGRARPAASFFALFVPGALRQTFDIVGSDRQAQDEAVRAEEALLDEIQKRLVTNPLPLYNMVDMDDEAAEECNDDDEDSDEELEDDADVDRDDGEDGERSEATGRAARGGTGRRARRTATGSGSAKRGLPTLLARYWPLLLLLLLGSVTFFTTFLDVVVQVRQRYGFDKW